MCDWVGSIMMAEFRQAMDGLVVFPKTGNGEVEKADERTCKRLAARLLRRATKLSTKQVGPTSSDEAVCISYFFPGIIEALKRIALIFDPDLQTANADGPEEGEEDEATATEEEKIAAEEAWADEEEADEAEAI